MTLHFSLVGMEADEVQMGDWHDTEACKRFCALLLSHIIPSTAYIGQVHRTLKWVVVSKDFFIVDICYASILDFTLRENETAFLMKFRDLSKFVKKADGFVVLRPLMDPCLAPAPELTGDCLYDYFLECGKSAAAAVVPIIDEFEKTKQRREDERILRNFQEEQKVLKAVGELASLLPPKVVLDDGEYQLSIIVIGCDYLLVQADYYNADASNCFRLGYVSGPSVFFGELSAADTAKGQELLASLAPYLSRSEYYHRIPIVWHK